ncbi:Mpo1 family 2-hydroxy fatty acid dioxygenase [Microvirga sp. 2TAF3]|uniref:Mpo1 family 2-hydroxy fatty acid dioxygenase n=1 Tax=Microvirga sp. 2TAF3 TaxID=3233014 RepID=UPI003F9682F2
MPTLFERQLASYSGYHQDQRNRATHFIGIPAIVFSLILILALWQVRLGELTLSGAWIVGFFAALGWIALDFSIGLAMTAVLIVMATAADWFVAHHGSRATWVLFSILFIGGWAFQFLGHAFEGKRPALMDNLFQAFIGPMFIMAELLMLLGLRRDLARYMGDKAEHI